MKQILNKILNAKMVDSDNGCFCSNCARNHMLKEVIDAINNNDLEYATYLVKEFKLAPAAGVGFVKRVCVDCRKTL